MKVNNWEPKIMRELSLCWDCFQVRYQFPCSQMGRQYAIIQLPYAIIHKYNYNDFIYAVMMVEKNSSDFLISHLKLLARILIAA